MVVSSFLFTIYNKWLIIIIKCNKMLEEWRPIVGFEGLYEVSNTGIVRTQGRTIEAVRNGTTYTKSYPPRTMAISNGKGGYQILCLYKNGKHYNKSLHRLVAETFIPNPGNLPQINHKDENILNNHADNLEWCDAKYNCNYGKRTEKSIAPKRKPVGCYKDGALVKTFVSQAQAGREMGVESSGISMCCNGKIPHFHGYEWRFINKETN